MMVFNFGTKTKKQPKNARQLTKLIRLGHGVYHCEDGPAIEWNNGTKWWYLNGERLTEEEFKTWQIKQSINVWVKR